MKSQIVKILLFVSALLTAESAYSISPEQINPQEMAIIVENEVLIANEQTRQTVNKATTDLVMLEIARVYEKVRKWESQKNKYYSQAVGFTSQLKSGAKIYTESIKIIEALIEIVDAVHDCPTGLLASGFTTNIYLDVISECVHLGTIYKESVGEGGDLNMLSGSDRTKMLWELEDQFKSVRKKLDDLAICIRYYRLTDVWDKTTAGLITRGPEAISKRKMDNWRRSAKVANEHNKISGKNSSQPSYSKK